MSKIIYNKKLYVGMKNYKKMYVELEIKQESNAKEKLTTTLQPITDYNSLSMCGNGGQNIEETADIKGYTELFISENDLKTIIDVWEKWHLNDTKAGTEKQQAFIDEWGKNNKYDYKAVCEALKRAGLYKDNGYKYGHSWLINPLPEEVITKITTIFEKYSNAEHIEKNTDKAVFKEFEVKAKYKGDKAASWDQDNYNNHLITVINKNNKKRCTFEFWASIAKPEINTEHDILNAFYCFVSDAISGTMDFNEFCSELGYNEDSITAEKIWKACMRSTAKLDRIYEGDICELANDLQERCS